MCNRYISKSSRVCFPNWNIHAPSEYTNNRSSYSKYELHYYTSTWEAECCLILLQSVSAQSLETLASTLLSISILSIRVCMFFYLLYSAGISGHSPTNLLLEKFDLSRCALISNQGKNTMAAGCWVLWLKKRSKCLAAFWTKWVQKFVWICMFVCVTLIIFYLFS